MSRFVAIEVMKYQVCSSEVAFITNGWVVSTLVQTIAKLARILPASSVSLTLSGKNITNSEVLRALVERLASAYTHVKLFKVSTHTRTWMLRDVIATVFPLE